VLRFQRASGCCEGFFLFVFRCDANVRVWKAVYIMLLYRSISIAELPSIASERKCYGGNSKQTIKPLAVRGAVPLIWR
jgi:hypothetical protein